MDKKIANVLIQQSNYTKLEQEKIRFGVQVIVSELYKLLIVYGVAIVLNSVIPTLLVHGTFFLIRQVTFGAHFQKALYCVVGSVLIFSVVPAFLVTQTFSIWMVWLVGVLSAVVILSIAPVGTSKQPIISERHRIYLRKKLYIRLVVLCIVCYLLPYEWQYAVVYGVMVQMISLVLQFYNNKRSVQHENDFNPSSSS